jgi:acyl-CoA synthetase (AMP-forming)/AMP-acid ligase II
VSPVLSTLLVGGTTVVLRRGDVDSLVAALASQRVTSLALVPTQFAKLLDDSRFRPEWLDHCRYVLSAGSALDDKLRRTLFELFPASFVEGYGSAETDHVCRVERRAPISKRGTVGKPSPGLALRILGDRDEALHAGEVGEIAVCSPSNMLGYYNRPELTKSSFIEDSDGKRFFRTGDLGRLDEEGCLRLEGRQKDMIITAGLNVYPKDIESVLVEHPVVGEVAVIGVPNAVLGEMPCAFVVPRTTIDSTDSDSLRASICRWANARLSSKQNLYEVRIVDALPRNATGKVMKQRLRELL